ncbi:MAG: hypothetical protein EOP22_19770 [Hyphomicrobiales bacterium]|nr:MAG: hypothetical protein EOP22_19770 [Hyphomicrobiales bacterium]
MSSPDLQTVVIACPNCGTRYQVPYGTIGALGREVQCAQCSRHWHATADAPPPPAIEDDLMFTPGDESVLDAAFEAEARSLAPPRPAPSPVDAEHARTLAEIKAAIAPKPKPAANPNDIDPALLTKSRRAFERRQARLSNRLPLAQVRRSARFVALLTLVAVLVLGFSLRYELVRWFPQLAGLYGAVGLPVNVVGLEFDASRTMTTYRDGRAVMLITSRIRSVSTRTVPVPPVLVSLLDSNGAIIYEWTAAARAPEMGPGEVQEFSTEVSAPPGGAVTVRLSFANTRGGNGAAASLGTL